MTDAGIIALAVANPLVRERHRKPDGSSPSSAELEGLAQSELQNEINALLAEESIRRYLLEDIYEETLSDGTSVDQGVRFEAKSFVASIVDITIGDDHRPLGKKQSKVEFNRWWYDRGGDANTSETAECWVPWDRSSDGDIRYVISPGVGSDATGYVHFVRKVPQPVTVSVITDDLHYLVVIGVVNRMTGYTLDRTYQRELLKVKRRLDPVKGGATPMPHSDDLRDFCYWQSIDAAGPQTSENPLFISRG